MLCRDEPECVLYHELVLTSHEYMRNVIEVDPAWLIEIAPHYYAMQDFVKPTTIKKKDRHIP
jgi:hypothetical protein